MTLRARLTVVVAVAVAAAVLLAVGVAWVATEHRLRGEVDDSLTTRAQALAELPAMSTYAHRANPDRAARPRPARGLEGVRIALVQDISIQVIGAQGWVSTLAGTELPVHGDEVTAAAAGGAGFNSGVDVDGVPFRVRTEPIPGGGAIQVGRDVTDIEHTLDELAVLLTVVAVVGVAVAALVGLLVSRRALRPIDRLTEATERVARDQDFDEPLPEPTTYDEVGRLTTSFNTMLAALAGSRAQQQRLVTDASHELRTPLTSLRTTIELLRRADRAAEEPDDGASLPAEQRRELYDHALGELEELTHLSSELVDLATDARVEREAPSTVALTEVATAVAARAARRSGQRIDVEGDASTIAGRPAAIERAVTNLIDNAAKWNEEGEAIEVSVAAGVVRVRDRGPGVPPDERERVFERFARGADTQSVPGSGLGLSIVRQVAEDHGGRAWLEAAPGGGTVAVLDLSGADFSSDSSAS